ncbi:MAG: F0F1 ATP synthase subunit gamma [Gammaproteobacteria bacterium]|jgi:F-type H+-transporting ATPase subunit gamma
MTRRRDLEGHLHSLAEIREIMNSMKTLAYMETRKLERFLHAQQAVVDNIEEAAADFLGFYPQSLPDSAGATPVYVVIGSERGFCGDFVNPLRRQLEQALQRHPGQRVIVITVGRKLHALLDKDERVQARLDGAGVVEDIPLLLDRILDLLLQLQQELGVLSLHCIYHSSDDEVTTDTLLPPFAELLSGKPRFAHPPLLNREPDAFMIELADQYLFAALHAILYASLMAENHRRVVHLEGAVRHLDDESAELERRSNILRQEEITEEIEVLLLSAATLDGEPGAQREKPDSV